MPFVIELRRKVAKTLTGRKAGPRVQSGTIGRYIEDGELLSVVKRFGPKKLPILSGLDPYKDQLIGKGEIDKLLSEVGKIDLDSLDPAERELFTTLLLWARQCSEDRELRINFSGD
ncbi:hypothetical protein [Kitasatospora sp. NPDC090308]|uniref:hypothetical protein n=1 Tax=Kitasatospora sp. NPDC090308 TaxID=3364082 RepID=UPI00382B83BF